MNPIYLYEVMVNGRRLKKGMEATLVAGTGYPAGRYRFEYAESPGQGWKMLKFFGPTRRKRQRYREVYNEADVRIVHAKTKEGQ